MGTTAETYSWPEGQLRIWTGAAGAETFAYVFNANVQVTYGWLNRGPTLGGSYTDHLTGQVAYANMQAAYTYDIKPFKIAASGTAVHMELYQSGVNGSAGLLLYSGRIDGLNLFGQEGGTYRFGMNCHFNNWSAYGGG